MLNKKISSNLCEDIFLLSYLLYIIILLILATITILALTESGLFEGEFSYKDFLEILNDSEDIYSENK